MYKTLLHTKIIKKEMLDNLSEGVSNTGIFFESRYSDTIKMKAHITTPAMREIKKQLINEFGDKQAPIVMKKFFEILLGLNNTNTALLSLYIPENFFGRKIREEINNKNN